MARPRPLMEALNKALDKVAISADHRNVIVKALVPYSYAHEAILGLFNHASDLMGICGVDGRFRHVNTAFEAAMGWSFEELTTRPFFDFVHPNDLEITRSKMEKLRAGLDVVRFENRWKTRSGEWKRLSWICPAPPEGNKDLFALARIIPDA
jgi:PAS domain S-box-containing protein